MLFIVLVLFKVFEMMKEGDEFCVNLWCNVNYFCMCMEEVGFILVGKDYVIIFVMLGDVCLVSEMVDKMFEKGIYVIGFFYFVVLKG